MKSERTGKWLICIGLLLIAAALCLTVFNINEQAKANKAATEALEKLEENKITEPPEIPAYIIDPTIPMPIKEIDGLPYIGVVSIPSLEIKLPLINKWSYYRLQIAPCRYSGSVYMDNMIVMAHNYTGFFGSLGEMEIGSKVYFEDMQGNVFSYEVVEILNIHPGDVEGMKSGDWDLSLFTCTVGGNHRITVRCERTAE